jgi:iron complex transport system permease protein
MKKQHLKWLLFSLVLVLLLLLSMMVSLATGEMKIPLSQIPDLLFRSNDGMESLIIRQIRLPRILLGFAVGGGLSLAGVILQGVFKNPLVEPYTLGISGGAALGVTISIVFGLHLILGSFMLPAMGFLGALVTIVLVYSISSRGGKIRVQQMLLIGVMISFVASSAMMFLMATTSVENLHGIVFWMMGSLDEPNSKLIAYAIIVSLLGLMVSFFYVQPLNALRLGESKARNLGVNTDLTIRILFLISSVLTGVCVSVAGVIGFVGLIIPHLMRLIMGNDYRILIISSYLAGAIFLILSDTLARVIIAPNELPIGVITGILGGAVFIVVLGKSVVKNRLG